MPAPATHCQCHELFRETPLPLGQFSSILAMVSAGMGVSVVPEMAIEQRPDRRFIPLADAAAYRRTGVVQKKQHFRSRVHRTFLEHLMPNRKPGEVFLGRAG